MADSMSDLGGTVQSTSVIALTLNMTSSNICYPQAATCISDTQLVLSVQQSMHRYGCHNMYA
jgi:hypothetical protein